MSAAGFSAAASAGDTVISGTATAIDGDQLSMQGYRILLHGIDAPELEQTCDADGAGWPCGRHAAGALADRIDGQTLECTDTGDAPYAKISAVCRAGEVDLNGWLVSEGWALALRSVTRAYVEHEAAARKAGRGLWRGRFVKPWDWRRGERLD